MENIDLDFEAPRMVMSRSRALNADVQAVVCVPTFRRPQHLRKTLDSLVEQRAHPAFAVVIVENDATRAEGAQVAAQFLQEGRLQGLCIVEPRQGNCCAINAAFEAALTTFPSAVHFLMIDDDEIASPDWLQLMVQAAENSHADVIGGPVWPVFDDAVKQGLQRHPAFWPAYETSGPVPIIYGSGNCLIKRSVFAQLGLPAFDLRFNYLGGGDVDFFTRCRRAGLTFYWVAEASINESVPESRTNPGWLAMRGLRTGAINYHVQRKVAWSIWSRAKLFAKVLALMPLSVFRTLRLAITEHRVLIALHPMIVAAGGALAVIGFEPHQYKASKTTP